MGLSRLQKIYSGSMNFTLDFALGYLKEDDIVCYVQGELDEVTSEQLYRDLVFTDTNMVTVQGDAPDNGAVIVFERTTDRENLVNVYGKRASLTDDNLNESLKQAMMIAHETLDGRFGTIVAPLDMGSNNIINLADGVNPTDAVTKSQLDTVASAVVAGTLPDGTYGDITVAASGSELNLNNGAVTEAKLNTGSANAGEIFIADGLGGGAYGEPASAVYNTYTDRFTATAGQTTFTLSNTPALTTVWVDGAVQEGDTYLRTGDDIVLDTPLDGGETVVVTYTTGIIGTVTGTLGSLTDVDSAGVTEGQVLKRGVSGYEFGDVIVPVKATPTQVKDEEATDGSGKDLFVTPEDMVYHHGVAKAHANFKGTGTVTLRGGFNVSSLTDYTTGQYGFNFTTPFANTNYGMTHSVCNSTSSNLFGLNVHTNNFDVDTYIQKTVSACRVIVRYGLNTSFYDIADASVAFFGER